MGDQDDDRTTEPVPEADALEQTESVEDESSEDQQLPAGFELPDDAAEADAIEQAMPVPGQDEDDAPR
jgi:hypothetical protein